MSARLSAEAGSLVQLTASEENLVCVQCEQIYYNLQLNFPDFLFSLNTLNLRVAEHAFPGEGSAMGLSWLRCRLVLAAGWGRAWMRSILAVLAFHNPLPGTQTRWKIKLSKLSVS